MERIDRTDLRSAIERAMAGDTSAFADLYAHFHGSTLNLAFHVLGDRAEAEDVCQEVWLQVRRELPRLRSSAAFSAWLRKISATAALRRAARTRAHEGEAVLTALPADSASDPVEHLQRREEASLAWDALAALSPKQRTALYLREVEEYDYRQIAATIDASVSTVESLLFRARKSLAQKYHRLAESPQARCRRAQAAMAALVDGEGGVMDRLSLRGHAMACRVCRAELLRLNDGSRIHAALPLPSLTAAVAIEAPAAAGSALGLPKLALLLANGQAVPALLAAGIAVASVATAGVPGLGGREAAGDVRPPAIEVTVPAQTAQSISMPTAVAEAEVRATARVELEPPDREGGIEAAQQVQASPGPNDSDVPPSADPLGVKEVLPDEDLSALQELSGDTLHDLTGGSSLSSGGEERQIALLATDEASLEGAVAEAVAEIEDELESPPDGLKADTDASELLPENSAGGPTPLVGSAR